jgi:hypothetical protein
MPKGQGYEVLNAVGQIIGHATSRESALKWLELMGKFR